VSGVGSIERTRKQFAAVGSLVAGALAVYWLVEMLRKNVPDIAARDVKLTIAFLSILALGFGLVTKRPQISRRITVVPMIVAPWAAAWSGYSLSQSTTLAHRASRPASSRSYSSLSLFLSASLGEALPNLPLQEPALLPPAERPSRCTDRDGRSDADDAG
jgi:hypothetical protein